MNLVPMWLRVGWITVWLAACITACFYGSPDPPSSQNNITTNATAPKHKNWTIDMNSVLGGWPPSKNLTAKWTNWLHDYKAKQDAEKAAEEAMRANMTLAQWEKLKKERGDWPANWQDLGLGHSGEVPPPWAYAPRYTGLPDFCYQWPKRGDCQNTTIRWGFNSHANRCDQFEYSGCGENQNNFKDQLSCEQACMIPPVSGCDTESQIPASDYNNILDQ